MVVFYYSELSNDEPSNLDEQSWVARESLPFPLGVLATDLCRHN